MKRKKQRRAGATETFSVSVDPQTKRALRALADSDFGGNLSALVTDLAEEARRRMAARAYLRRHNVAAINTLEAADLQARVDKEIMTSRMRTHAKEK
jgi:hypothetical protein